MTAPVADSPGHAAPPPVEPERKPKAATRKRMTLWDRVRLLLLFVVAWLIVVWASMADNPLLPFTDAALIQLRDSQWLLWLAGLEVIRQIHFFISEKSPGYHRFWSEKVFGGFNRAIHRRFSDWTRYRLSRLIKIVLFLALLASALSTGDLAGLQGLAPDDAFRELIPRLFDQSIRRGFSAVMELSFVARLCAYLFWRGIGLGIRHGHGLSPP